jgi:TonB family protein
MRTVSLVVTLICVCLFSSASPQNSPSTKEGIKVNLMDLHPPIPISTPPAEFPAEARIKNLEGVCVISIVVDVQGKPQNPQVVRCSDTIFADNSIIAVMGYKFKPAHTDEGKNLPVKLTIEVNFRLKSEGPFTAGTRPQAQIRYAFLSPPGITSSDPGPDGVYPLSELVSMPKMIRFVSKDFEEVAFRFPNGVGCRVVLTIDAKGKPSDAQVTSCDNAFLEKPAVNSVLSSKYEPARLNGKAVPVRSTIHIIYDGFPHKTP